jgi:hypothetical protein
MDLYVLLRIISYFLVLNKFYSLNTYHSIYLFQVSLLTENGNTKDDLKLPTDENLLNQVLFHLPHRIFSSL